MITLQEVEMLAALLQRAGVNRYEAIWANTTMNKLRAIAAEAEAEAKQEKKVPE